MNVVAGAWTWQKIVLTADDDTDSSRGSVQARNPDIGWEPDAAEENILK